MLRYEMQLLTNTEYIYGNRLTSRNRPSTIHLMSESIDILRRNSLEQKEKC